MRPPVGLTVNTLKGFVLTVLVALLGTTTAEAQVPSLDARVNMNVVEQDLSQVVQFLRERSGANIVILAGGENKVRDLQLSDVHWRDALEYAVELAGCVVEEDKSGVLAISRPVRVTFNFPDADIREIIDTIGKVSGANIITGPEVSGTLAVRLNDVPWRDALDEIVKTRGYTVVQEKRGILRVVDPATLKEQMFTRYYRLRFLRPRGDYVPVINSEFVDGNAQLPRGDVKEHFTVLDAFRSTLTNSGNAKGELEYIDSENVLMITDTVQVHESIREIINRLDVEPAQVFCDVKFVSTLNTDLLSLGVDYGDEGPKVSLSGGQIPITFPFDLGEGGFEDYMIVNRRGFGPFANPDLNEGATITPSTIFGALSFTEFQATLRLLQRDTKAEVIQAPKLITLDGKAATIFVGETVRYAEAKSEQGQAGGLVLSVEEAQGSPVEVGFQLLVRPYVVPGASQMMMEIIPKETSLSGDSTGSSLAPAGFDIFTVGAAGLEGSIALPRTRASTMVTQMMLHSGQTAVIGGLTTDTDTTIVSRVPFLGRIPIIGWLFKHKADTRDRRSLVIFLTPYLLQSPEDNEAVLQMELSRRRSRLKDELDALYESAGSPYEAD